MNVAHSRWLAACTFALAANTGSAITIDPFTDNSWNVDYYYTVGANTLHVAQTYNWDGDTARLQINTTFDALPFQASLMSFGFNLSPDLAANSVSMLLSGTKLDTVGQEKNLPSIDNNIDVCVWGANNCSGGSINQGLSQGQSDSVTLAFSNLQMSALTFDLYGLKIQSALGSFEFNGCEAGCTRVSEPGTLLLLGLGLAGLAGGRRWLDQEHHH